mmetsp:Transcript_27316/g.24197  ORF Transcript_27316/g.24197 Transcript_27316/m.24197 type:complete len:158 (+) Transcript_27316:526-999(+)
MREDKYFISYDWDEIDLEGEFYEEEVLLSNTYLNVINNLPQDNKLKISSKNTEGGHPIKSTEAKIKWGDELPNKSLVIFIPENYKASPKSKFVNLGDFDLVPKRDLLFEKSVPISEDESEDMSSMLGSLSSVKGIRKKDYKVRSRFSNNKILSFKNN